MCDVHEFFQYAMVVVAACALLCVLGVVTYGAMKEVQRNFEKR